MKDISFYSGDTYILLPNRHYTKVALAISTATHSKNAYKLYNPFSFKGKILKNLTKLIAQYFNPVLRYLKNVETYEKSPFVKHLEEELKVPLTTSVYNATDKNKVVIQLQSNNAIYGYLKFPLNRKGIKQLVHEGKAIRILSKKQLVQPNLYKGWYRDIPYFISPEIKGECHSLPEEKIQHILNELKKENKFLLKEHPRVQKLCQGLEEREEIDLLDKTLKIIHQSKELYTEVFEHGDFAPWNMIEDKGEVHLFDFEFFEQQGLEYFDLIKYHFQIGRLLRRKQGQALVHYVEERVDIVEIKLLFSLFLIKEVTWLRTEGKDYRFHLDLLSILE